MCCKACESQIDAWLVPLSLSLIHENTFPLIIMIPFPIIIKLECIECEHLAGYIYWNSLKEKFLDCVMV